MGDRRKIGESGKDGRRRSMVEGGERGGATDGGWKQGKKGLRASKERVERSVEYDQA